MTDPIDGRATPGATERWADHVRDDGAGDGHVRTHDALPGLHLSSIGLGTYLGEADAATDGAMAGAVADCVRRGVNVVDAAINYRGQRSERSIAEGLRTLTDDGTPREAVFVSTKGGFLVPGMPPGLVAREDVAADCHAMTPAYLDWALGQSLDNLGLATVDLYHLHNPETQLQRHDTDAWLKHLADAIQWLEGAADDGRLAAYGLATWNGLRVPPGGDGHIPLERVVETARDVGGPDHRLRAVQLPLNLGMPQALTDATQPLDGDRVPALEAAERLGLAVFTSASTAQGRLTGRLPEGLADDVPGAGGSPTRALLQWTRSCPGVTTALIGMTREDHRDEDLELVRVAPMDPDTARMMVTG